MHGFMEEGEELSFWGIRCIDEDERYPFLIKAEGPELADIELPACVEADYPVLEDIDPDVAKRLPGLLIGFGALTGTGLVTLSVGVVGVMMEGIAVGTILGPVSAMTGEPLDYKSKFAGAVQAGVYMIGGGLLCMVTGTTVYCVYKKKLKNMTELCNGSSKDIRLSFGAKKHGIGLSLDF